MSWGVSERERERERAGNSTFFIYYCAAAVGQWVIQKFELEASRGAV